MNISRKCEFKCIRPLSLFLSYAFGLTAEDLMHNGPKIVSLRVMSLFNIKSLAYFLRIIASFSGITIGAYKKINTTD